MSNSIFFGERKIPKTFILKSFVLLFLFAGVFLPDGIKKMFVIYKMTTNTLPISFTYNYYYTFFDLLITIIGLFYYFKNKNTIRFFPIIMILFLFEIIRFCRGESNVFELKSYESFLLLLEAISWVSIFFSLFASTEERNKAINLFIYLVFLAQIIQFILGNFSVDGRVGAVSLGPGATATIYFDYALWFLFVKKENNTSFFPLIVTFIGTVLTGSRTNIIMLVLVCFIFSFTIVNDSKRVRERRKVYAFFFLGTMGMLFFVLFSNSSFDFLDRIITLFDGDLLTNISNDSSILGRLRSIYGGLDILKENPFGISNSVFDIEYRSSNLFGMEYPHSSLLCYVLMWSPLVTTVLFIYILKITFELKKQKNSSWIFLLIILVKSVIYGGPILYVSGLIMNLLIFSYIKVQINDKDFNRKVTL